MSRSSNLPHPDSIDFRELLELAPDGVIVHDGETILYANVAAHQLLRMPHDATLYGAPVRRYIPATFVDADSTFVRSTVRREATLVRHDGQPLEAELISNRATRNGRSITQIFLHDISARRRADEQVRRSEERFRAVTAVTQDAVWEVDLTTEVIEFNEPAQGLFAYDTVEENLTLSRWLNKVHPDDRARVEGSIRAAISGDASTWSDEFRFQRGDGRWIDVIDRAQIFRDGDGRATRAVGAMSDVTDRNATQRALRESESRFRSLVEQSLVGVYILQDGVITYVNPRACEIFERDASELIGMPATELVHPDDRANVSSQMRLRLDGTQERVTYRTRAVRPGGEVIIVEIFGGTIHIEGKPALMGMIHDITDAAVSLEERESMLRQLAAERERLDAFIHTIPGMVWEIWFTRDGARGQRKFVSAHVEELFGYTVEEWLSMSEASLKIVHPDDRAQVEEAIRLVGVNGKGSATFRGVRKDGREVDVFAQAVAIRDASGSMVGLRGVSIDVTRQRRLEQQLDQASRMASLGQLAATIAHEFNNVLMSVQPTIDLLPRRHNLDSELSRLLELMRGAVQRGRAVTQEILRFTRPAEPNLEALDIDDWFRRLRPELRSLVGRSVTLTTRVEEPALFASADPAQLGQVLVNLVANARDAMTSGGNIDVIARVEPEGATFDFAVIDDATQYVHILVKDDGPGMSQETAARIFEPLFTTKRSGGTGLGLTVVHNIVTRHGGQVFVESEIGKGTTFHIFIRRAAVDARAVESSSEQTTHAFSRVLLVEDDAAVAAGLEALLACEAITTSVCPTGEGAVDAVSEFQPDAVVLDVGLPDIDGLEVYRRLSARWPELPVVFSTGHGDETKLEQHLAQGHVGFLLKPYELEQLLRALDRVTRRD